MYKMLRGVVKTTCNRFYERVYSADYCKYRSSNTVRPQQRGNIDMPRVKCVQVQVTKFAKRDGIAKLT